MIYYIHFFYNVINYGSFIFAIIYIKFRITNFKVYTFAYLIKIFIEKLIRTQTYYYIIIENTMI